MPDDKKTEESKPTNLQKQLNTIDELKDLAIKNLTAKTLLSGDSNNSYKRPPSKLRKVIGLKGLKGFKGFKSSKKRQEA
jgi:hypothetical protein